MLDTEPEPEVLLGMEGPITLGSLAATKASLARGLFRAIRLGLGCRGTCGRERRVMLATGVTAEDRFRQQRRDNVVGHIDHVGYVKIDRNAADDVGLLAAKPALLQ